MSEGARMRATRFFVTAIAIVIGSCEIADEDRCVAGFTWDPKVQSCRKDAKEDTDDDSDSTTSDLDSGIDTSGDSGPNTDVDTGSSGPQGLGEPCTKDGNECAEYEIANYCAYDPTDPEAPGICTIENCNPGGCPYGYQCCNCMNIVVTCVPDDGVAAAIEKGCTCS